VRGTLVRQSLGDHLQDPLGISQHIIIPEPEHSILMSGEPSIAYRITLVRRMLPAIHLDNESLLATDKIDNVGSDRFLTNEFMAHQAARAQVTP
jgi:hypothetical protein